MTAPTAPDGDSAAVLSVKIDNLTQTVEHLRDDLKAQSETYVRKDVYAEKTTALDREIVAVRKTVDESKAAAIDAVTSLAESIEKRRVPWTALGAFIVGGLGLLFSILPKLAA